MTKDAITTPLAEKILAATATVKTLKIQGQIKTNAGLYARDEVDCTCGAQSENDDHYAVTRPEIYKRSTGSKKPWERNASHQTKNQRGHGEEK